MAAQCARVDASTLSVERVQRDSTPLVKSRYTGRPTARCAIEATLFFISPPSGVGHEFIPVLPRMALHLVPLVPYTDLADRAGVSASTRQIRHLSR